MGHYKYKAPSTIPCVARKDAQVQTMSDLFTKELPVGAPAPAPARLPIPSLS
jgi:hypothetical protein